MNKDLTEAANKIVSVAVEAGKHVDLAAADRAVEDEVVRLSLEMPPGYKARVTDALIQIVKIHVREKVLSSEMLSHPAE
jgi:hypothetical protein